jgi:hypothetical protein
VGDGNDGIDRGECAAYNRSSNSSSHPPSPSPCSEGRKWRKRENHGDHSASTTLCATHSNTERERDRRTASPRVFCWQRSSIIRTLHPSLLPEIHPVSLEFIPHSHSSSILSSRRTSARLRIHPSFREEEHQSPQSSSYTRTLHPSFILNEHQSPPRGILLTEFIPHPYSSTILSRRISVDYSQYTVTKVHPSSALFIHPAEEDQRPSSSSCICTLHSILSSE